MKVIWQEKPLMVPKRHLPRGRGTVWWSVFIIPTLGSGSQIKLQITITWIAFGTCPHLYWTQTFWFKWWRAGSWAFTSFLKLPEWFKCVTVDGDHCSSRSNISTCIRNTWNAIKVGESWIRSRAPALEFCVWGQGIWIFFFKLLRFPYAHSSWRPTRLEYWRHRRDLVETCG